MSLFSRKLIYPLYCSAARNLAFCHTFGSADGKPLVIVDYLIKTIGLSCEAAIISSKYISHHKSLPKSDAVLRFFKESGFCDAHIISIVSKRPSILSANVDTTLKPKFTAMKELGFSESEIIRLVSANPDFLFVCDIHSRIKFWKSFLGSEYTFKFFIRAPCLINFDTDTNIMPKISFLRSLGCSNNQIKSTAKQCPTVFTSSLDSLRNLSKRVEQMGFTYGSWGFPLMLAIISQISTERLNSKLKLLRSIGWSEADISLAIKKVPILLRASEKKIKLNVDFLVNKVGLVPSFVIKHPPILLFSLQRRMVPRNHVLQLLKANDLLKTNFHLPSFMAISEKLFLEKYVTPYQDKIPELHTGYLALLAGNLTSAVLS